MDYRLHQEESLKQAYSDVLEQALSRLSECAGTKLADRVQVVWNSRMRSAAGRAFWPDARVELNPKLLGISMSEVRRTLLHELAHILAYHRAGRREIAPHGIEWQQACCDLGIPGESATHRLPLGGTRQRMRWRYVCPSCQVYFERARRIGQKSACYRCCHTHNGGKYHVDFLLKEHYIS